MMWIQQQQGGLDLPECLEPVYDTKEDEKFTELKMNWKISKAAES